MSKVSLGGKGKILLDTRIFRKTKLTIFEALVKHLKEDLSMSFHEMGELLDRDERNIWTVYNRSKKK